MQPNDRVEVDQQEVQKAFDVLSLQKPPENDLFREKLRGYAAETGQIYEAKMLYGLSASNVKAMRKGDAKYPDTLPGLLVSFIFVEIDLDVTPCKTLRDFHKLGFDIQLSMDVETQNTEDTENDTHALKNLYLEMHEAKAVVEDPDDSSFELDIRIGFDRTRLAIRAEKLRSVGNHLAAEIARMPGTGSADDYTGWFRMRLASRTPLSWFFDPKEEGNVLDGRVDSEDLGRVETARGSSIVAEISARRDALKVRIVEQDGGRKASKSLADEHRDKMCAAVTRKSFAGAADEFLIHRVPLTHESQMQPPRSDGVEV